MEQLLVLELEEVELLLQLQVKEQEKAKVEEQEKAKVMEAQKRVQEVARPHPPPVPAVSWLLSCVFVLLCLCVHSLFDYTCPFQIQTTWTPWYCQKMDLISEVFW